MSEPTKRKEEIDPETKKFFSATDITQEPLLIILRAHLLMEYYIDQILMASLKRGDALKKMGFYNKLLVLKSLQIFPDEVIESITGLNKVRNHTSHVRDYQISEDDVDKIGKSFGLKYLRIKKDHSGDIKRMLQFALIAPFISVEMKLKDFLKVSPTK